MVSRTSTSPIAERPYSCSASWKSSGVASQGGEPALAGCGKTTSFSEICNPHYAELKIYCSETDCEEGKCLYLRLVLPAFAACGHTSPVPHAAPTGLASRFRIRTRLYAAAAKVNTHPTL